MLDYYHSNTAAGRPSPSTVPPSNPLNANLVADAHRGYTTSNSSDDALSMGPNGYYHPQRSSAASPASRSSSRSSSPTSYLSASSDHHDTADSRRHSGATVRSNRHHDDDPRQPHHSHHQDMTPTRGSYRSSDTRTGRESPASSSAWSTSTGTVQRKPSRRAAANADNRRIAIMEIDNPALPSSSHESSSNQRNNGSASGTYTESPDGSRPSSRRGMSDPSQPSYVAFMTTTIWC